MVKYDADGWVDLCSEPIRMDVTVQDETSTE